ncbi:MAG: TaqI-like C-terminal specificity domain-containing protein, partial [Bacteroidales bacterium]|nr:TaqI-like C-terminal specificity domain-containing protein [Bacteroidales bacterium]
NLVNLVDSADASNCERSKANNNLQDSQDFASETSRSIRRFVEHHEMQPELEPYREVLDTSLRNVKICDPAIGSGAFPMGLLNELWRCREALAIREANNLQDFVSAASRSKLKKEIIENNIYGVDIEKGAIDIARLRFWLSIVVDAEEPEPLPNFDYKFMQGNSLIESYKGIDLSRISKRLRGGQSKSTQLLLGLDSDFSKKNLQRLMRDYFSVTDHKQKSSMRQAINDEVKRLITDFIGGTASDLNKLDPSANQDFFLWHTWFKDIFDNGGFDIVIGNPPYVVVEANGKYGDYETESCYDLYAYFFERAVKLLNSNGILSFITSSLYVKGLKYTSLRSFLQNNTSLIAFRIEGDGVFKNAGIPTATFIAKKTKGLWRFEDLYMDKSLTEKIRKGTMPLSSVSSIMRGFEIGRNMVDTSGQYKFLTGSDVSKYYYNKLSYISQSVLTAFSKDIKYFSKERILLRETGSFLTAVYVGNETIYSNRSLYSILITDKTLSTKYVLALLNSSLLQWYYSNMFKGDTELFPKIRIAQAKQLPIRKVSIEMQQPIIMLIDKILASKQSCPNADTSDIEHKINELVYQLYNLTSEEIAEVEQ